MRTNRAFLGGVHLGPLWAVEVLGKFCHVSKGLGVTLSLWSDLP